MSEKQLFNIGYYTFFEIKNKGRKKYKVDSGKTIFSNRYKKQIKNPYRDIKEFKTIEGAKRYVFKKLKEPKKTSSTIPKTLYLVQIKEEKTGVVFIKVGFTSKKFINRRFSKKYGYENYVIEEILRDVKLLNAEKYEEEIKNRIKKKRSIKKYRPILESFSGYSECFNKFYLTEITSIFDEVVESCSF